jgi:hypothetical protein
MYPMFPDVVRGVQQTLMRDILPDLQTDYAREQVGGLLLLLQHLLDQWDRARDVLEEEHADLRTTLAEVAAGGESGASTRTTDRVPATDGAVRTGEALIAEIREFRARLAATLDAAIPGSETHRVVAAFVVRQLARERAAVANTAPTWD